MVSAVIGEGGAVAGCGQSCFTDDQIGVVDSDAVVAQIGAAECQIGGIGASVLAAGLAGDGDRISGDETGGGLCELVLCAGVVGQLRGGGVDGGALGCHAHAGCGCVQGVVVITQAAIGAGA